MDQKEKLCNEVETVRKLSYFVDNVSQVEDVNLL